MQHLYCSWHWWRQQSDNREHIITQSIQCVTTKSLSDFIPLIFTMHSDWMRFSRSITNYMARNSCATSCPMFSIWFGPLIFHLCDFYFNAKSDWLAAVARLGATAPHLTVLLPSWGYLNGRHTLLSPWEQRYWFMGKNKIQWLVLRPPDLQSSTQLAPLQLSIIHSPPPRILYSDTN